MTSCLLSTKEPKNPWRRATQTESPYFKSKMRTHMRRKLQDSKTATYLLDITSQAWKGWERIFLILIDPKKCSILWGWDQKIAQSSLVETTLIDMTDQSDPRRCSSYIYIMIYISIKRMLVNEFGFRTLFAKDIQNYNKEKSERLYQMKLHLFFFL